MDIFNISVSKGRKERYRHIYSNSDWFNDSEYYILTETSHYLSIKKCGLQIPKKAQKFCLNSKRSKGGHFQCVSELNIGIYEIDLEESNEDEIIIYKQKPTTNV